MLGKLLFDLKKDKRDYKNSHGGDWPGESFFEEKLNELLKELLLPPTRDDHKKQPYFKPLFYALQELLNMTSKVTNESSKAALEAGKYAKSGNLKIFCGHKPYACLSILLLRKKYPNLHNIGSGEGSFCARRFYAVAMISIGAIEETDKHINLRHLFIKKTIKKRGKVDKKWGKTIKKSVEVDEKTGQKVTKDEISRMKLRNLKEQVKKNEINRSTTERSS
jgi:hypothetical protein